MRSMLRTILYVLVATLITSCTNKKKKEGQLQKENKDSHTNVIYTLGTSDVSLIWTAYKFTDRVGVSGTFEDITFETNNSTGIIDSILYKSRLSIPTISVYSNNEIRDPKLRTTFFKTFNTDTIRGQILTVNKGNGLVEIQLNNITREVPYSYTTRNDSIVIQARLDLSEWNGKQAIEALNKECYELHTGPDGVSKLWPDIQINMAISLLEVKKSY